MIRSMTAFASARGSRAPQSWAWELRSVNAKGLDLRLRVPDWVEGLEAALRARLGRAMTRGSVSLSLRLSRDEGAGGPALNAAALEAALAAVATAEARAADLGLALGPTSAAQLLSMRGVMEQGPAEDEDTAPLLKALMADIEPLIAAFLDMRSSEGAALAQVLAGQLDTIAALVEQAAAAVTARRAEAEAAFRAALARVMEGAEAADPQRVAQELALLAVKADVTEELDRLRAHVGAVRALLAEGGPVGRKLDFLMQEFNREANTLCSKSQNAELTRIGLELKTVIDQMREQVQNVE